MSAPRTQIALRDLTQNAPYKTELVPTPSQLKKLTAEMDVTDIRKLRLQVTLEPGPGKDWTLHGTLGASITQACGVTLEPVKTRIDTTFRRHFMARWHEPAEGEMEMPEDDTVEPMPDILDFEVVLREALALEIPAFPRKPELESLNLEATPPGSAPIGSEKVKPFAGLADLKAQLEQKEGDNS